MLSWSFSRSKEENGFSINIELMVFCMVALEHFSCTSIFCIVRNFLISTLELGADVPTCEDESGELWRQILVSISLFIAFNCFIFHEVFCQIALRYRSTCKNFLKLFCLKLCVDKLIITFDYKLFFQINTLQTRILKNLIAHQVFDKIHCSIIFAYKALEVAL